MGVRISILKGGNFSLPRLIGQSVAPWPLPRTTSGCATAVELTRSLFAFPENYRSGGGGQETDGSLGPNRRATRKGGMRDARTSRSFFEGSPSRIFVPGDDDFMQAAQNGWR